MYVTQNDYKGRITSYKLEMLIEEDPDGILSSASKSAEDTIRSLAAMLYDVDGELVKTGLTRNHFILSMAISIALYNIYQVADDEAVPDKVIKNYDDTIADLTKISNGKMSLSLPPAPVDSGSDSGTPGTDENASTTGTGLRRMGSASKRTHHI